MLTVTPIEAFSDNYIWCLHRPGSADAFAAALEPENIELQARIEHDSALRAHNTPTVPSNMAMELATNPFLRSSEPGPASHMQRRDGVDPGDAVSVFAAIRGWKDNF